MRSSSSSCPFPPVVVSTMDARDPNALLVNEDMVFIAFLLLFCFSSWSSTLVFSSSCIALFTLWSSKPPCVDASAKVTDLLLPRLDREDVDRRLIASSSIYSCSWTDGVSTVTARKEESICEEKKTREYLKIKKNVVRKRSVFAFFPFPTKTSAPNTTLYFFITCTMTNLFYF